MSIERNLIVNTGLSLSYLTKKISLAVSVFLLAMVMSLLSISTAFAAEPSALMGGSSSEESSTSTPLPDSFGRDTPRHAVQGFISALSENDYLLASNYLNLSK
ncbi:MAG: mechanosensitive ion channel family protein, partial [Psychrobacter alimentarius]